MTTRPGAVNLIRVAGTVSTTKKRRAEKPMPLMTAARLASWPGSLAETAAAGMRTTLAAFTRTVRFAFGFGATVVCFFLIGATCFRGRTALLGVTWTVRGGVYVGCGVGAAGVGAWYTGAGFGVAFGAGFGAGLGAGLGDGGAGSGAGVGTVGVGSVSWSAPAYAVPAHAAASSAAAMPTTKNLRRFSPCNPNLQLAPAWSVRTQSSRV